MRHAGYQRLNTGDIPNKYGSELTPLKVGDAIYGCTPMNKLFALNAATGEKLWMYDPQVPVAWVPYTAACRGVNRGTCHPAFSGADALRPVRAGGAVGVLNDQRSCSQRRRGEFSAASQRHRRLTLFPSTPANVMLPFTRKLAE